MAGPGLLDLSNRRSLVVGGGQGMGRATAMMLAQAGADVVVLDVVRDRAEAVVDEIQALGARASALVADVTKPDEVEHAIAESMEVFSGSGSGRESGLEIVANIVGLSSWAPLLSVDDGTWDRDFDINLKQHLYVGRAVARRWIEGGQPGVLCVVASASALFAAPRHGAYGAAKAGVLSFMRTAAEEWAPHGIRVNAVVPGAVRTPRIEASWADGSVPRPTDDLLDSMALPEDIAGAILYLVSDLSRKVTGQSLVVDGGWTTRFPYRLE